MNIFRMLASGRQPMREEYISALLAYLLSPKLDHGLGAIVLATLLRDVGVHASFPELVALASDLDPRLRDNLFEDAAAGISVELELYHPAGTSHGASDIVVRCGAWFIAIENKILGASATPGQIAAQYQGLRQVLAKKDLASHKVLMVYLVPAVRSAESWSLSQAAVDELNIPLIAGDRAALVTWQSTKEHPLAFVEMLRTILARAGRGEIAPLSSEIRHTLLALIDFALGEFRGYPYERAVVHGTETPTQRVASLLQSEEVLYIGVQYGMAGVMRRAWRNPGFGNDVDQAAYRAGYEDWTRETVLGHIPDCSLSVIEQDGQPIGRLRVLCNETGITLAGIQLLPAYQNQGIGTMLVTQLQRDADQRNLPLRIAVEKDNPNAQRFYERCGCRVIGEDAQEYHLEYRPRRGVGPQTP